MLRRTLLVAGFMGSGKSTVGPIVAARAGAPFVDLDAAIEAEAGRSVAALFAERGELAFRALEAAQLARALDGEPKVVAVGGGALLDRSRRRAALERATVVVLEGRPETIAARTAGPGRPLLDLPGASREATIRSLLAVRADAYAEAHGRVATDDRPPDEVASEVLSIALERRVVVPLGARTYVARFVSPGAPAVAAAAVALAPSSVTVVTDAHVAALDAGALETALTARSLRAASVVLSPGEENKRLAAAETILDRLLASGADRDALVVAHGGGVVGDVAGFAASVYLRGVRWIAVPTTVLAMADASVGGKTGVDLGLAKNAIGAFHQPRAVVVDVARSRTESERAYRAGLAEVVKAAAIADAALFGRLEANADALVRRDLDALADAISGAVAVKAAVVATDEREDAGSTAERDASGRLLDRATLNFGHTIGHALEAEGGFARLVHGEAVALGMVAALRAGERLGVTEAADAARVVALLARLGLPVDLDAQPLAAALPLVKHDKKRHGAGVRVILLRRIGDVVVQHLTPAALASAI